MITVSLMGGVVKVEVDLIGDYCYLKHLNFRSVGKVLMMWMKMLWLLMMIRSTLIQEVDKEV